MTKRNFRTLEEFKAHVHREGATLIEFSGTKVPCILMSPKKYEEEVLHSVYNRNVRADTLLDIFYDGRDVFVDVQLKLVDTDFEQNFFMIQLPKKDAAEHALEIIKANLKKQS